MTFEDLHRPLEAHGFRGATRWIILISGAMLILQQIWGEPLVFALGLTPALVLQHHYWWQPLTYLFLHGGLFHWLFNMFVFWMFGRELETRWGTVEFVKFFLITGLGAALCVLAITPHSTIPTIGSSGSVFGLLVAFAMLFPEATMYLYFLIPVKAWQAVALFAFIEFFAALQGGGSGISRFAHLGGMLTGYLYLRFGRGLSRWLTAPWRTIRVPFQKPGRRPARRSSVKFHEVTDDLVHEVDRILDKILKQGVDSLTKEEQKIMDQYSRLKR
ncbi:MAG: rhomboid family intramembrane serine protease [Elusimicrobiota bacterium]|jgi:membrane associated rhomboid family serine protease